MGNYNFSDKTVVYNNTINEFDLGNLSSIELNLLMYLFIMVRDKGTEEITISGSEIRSKAHLKNPNTEERLKVFFDNFREKMDNKVGHYEDKQFYHDKLFETITYSVSDTCLTVKLNESYKDLFNDISSNYTKFDLSEFCNLPGKYEKHLYRLLMQFENSTRWRKDTINNLRIYMGCPECYKNSTFLKEIVRPSLSILRDVFDNLQLETQNDKGKRGKPLTGTFFKWRKSIENTDDISEKNMECPNSSKVVAVNDTQYDDPIEIFENSYSHTEMSPEEYWKRIEECEEELATMFD